MPEDYDYYDEDSYEPKRKDNLFVWTIFILLLIGAVFACWLGSFYIFGHPEEPRSYRILKKLKKLEAPRRFDVTAAPQGEFLSPQRAFERFSALTRLELERENAELLRIYIKNYTETKKLVPYIRGKFEVVETYPLSKSDLIQQGSVALLQAAEYPQILVEHLFPATGSNIEMSKRLLVPGSPFSIEKTNDVTAIIHVDRMDDGRMLLTAVPLHYPSYALKGGAGTFSSEPPLDFNVAAGLPISKGDRLTGALKHFAQKETAEPIAEEPAKIADQGPSVVRLDNVPLGQKAPETGAIPELPVAKAEPLRPTAATPRPRPPSTELALNHRANPAGTSNSVPTARAVPFATPAPETRVAAATPPPAPPMQTPARSPSGVPLKPFVQSNAGVAPPSEGGANWRVYPAGSQPRGRTISPSEAAGLVDQGTQGERLYLSGNFFVTAKGDNKAVLRPRTSGGEAPSVRIIAEFPDGAPPPGEGEVFGRDASRGFEVRSIVRADDGQTVNVFVREITR
jgi:hypothetical protein